MSSDSSQRFSDSDDKQSLPPQVGIPRWTLALGTALCLLIVLGSVGLWFMTPSSQKGTFVDGPEARPVAISADGYVGSEACQTCHSHEHQTWHDSFHRTMTQVASPDAIVGDFDGVELAYWGHEYRLGRDKEEFWAEFDPPQTDLGESLPETIRRNIVLCTGSHTIQMYWISTGKGRELAMLPFVWRIAEQDWIPGTSSFVNLPPGHPSSPYTHKDLYGIGQWNQTCILCHTTHGEPSLEQDVSLPPQSTVGEFGIACEACHGPGESHISFHNKTEASARDTIINPLRLPHRRSSEVCGQCHMTWQEYAMATWEEVSHSGHGYRPGDNLLLRRKVVPDATQFWSDGMIRIIGREFNGLIASPCFQRGEMSCFSCHILHQSPDDERPRKEWTDDQLKPNMRTNQACIFCHEEYRSQDQLMAHTHHLASSHGSLCYNCHMPNTTYGLLKATRSHTVGTPSVAETVNAGRPNACNLCHLDKTLQWTGDTLVDWYGQKPPELAEKWAEAALSVQMALEGDAGQRAIIAWHMGWEPAREVSRDDWIAPYLAFLVQDDYPAVSFIAHRSLKKIGGYDTIAYHWNMTPEEQKNAGEDIIHQWQQQQKVLDRPTLFISETGELEMEKVLTLLQQRDQAVIYLAE